MKWNQHWELAGKHSFLSPSGYHWLNYDSEKLRQVYLNQAAKERGTKLHALASDLINMGVRLPRNNNTLNAFVNDAIGYRMRSEQTLYFSPHCFGTADAIQYNEKKHLLRIHDLKTGYIPAHMEQLEIYASLFFLEYNYDPHDITTILRIYQCDEVIEETADPDVLCSIMDTIVNFESILSDLDAEVSES